MEYLMNDYERIDDLECKGFKIIQDNRKFCFGMDAVLVSNFVGARSKDKIVDLGTGTGIIPILVHAKSNSNDIIGLEIQEDMVDMANRSVALNGLQDSIKIIQGDIKEAPAILGKAKYDLVITNPPYKKAGRGLLNPDDSKAIARHEILCTLEDILWAGARLLKFGGRFVMIHRPERLIDVMIGMRQSKLEPKRIMMIHPNEKKPPNLVLVEGVMGGGSNLLWMPPLFVYDDKGEFTPELKEIYNGEAT